MGLRSGAERVVMKKVVVTALAALAALAIIASASAAIAPANQKLTYEGPGVHVWHKGADSPRDRDSRALFLHVESGEYVGAYSQKSLHINKPAGAVRGLSFAFQASKHVGAGAPRISVKFGDGTYGFLSASYCNHPIADSGWSRASFTGMVNNCSLWAGDTQYAADGTRTALEVYADAHPGAVVKQAFFIADEEGDYRIDQLRLGAGVVYTDGNIGH
jgi:hypothetical protein